MDERERAVQCRSCASTLGEVLIDLEPQPDPDMLLDPNRPEEASTARVRAWICSRCALVQLVGPRPDGPAVRHGHQGDVTAAARDAWWARFDDLIPAADPLVVDVDVSDPGIGARFVAAGFPVMGFERDPDPQATDRPWLQPRQFDASAAASITGSGRRAGLIVASHALAHADDLGGLMAAIDAVLAPEGLIAIEFHHVLRLAEGQFDVLSHAHRSYFSLHAVEALLRQHGLVVRWAASTDLYGGTIRIVAQRDRVRTRPGRSQIGPIRRIEVDARVVEASGYARLPEHIEAVCSELRGFLADANRDSLRVAGYGAAARGTALLNIARIDQGQLPVIFDRSPAKHGRLVPGARIPVLATEAIDEVRPDRILVLPWPLAGEIAAQLSGARAWGARFVVAMPRLAVLP